MVRLLPDSFRPAAGLHRVSRPPNLLNEFAPVMEVAEASAIESWVQLYTLGQFRQFRRALKSSTFCASLVWEQNDVGRIHAARARLSRSRRDRRAGRIAAGPDRTQSRRLQPYPVEDRPVQGP